MMTLMRTRLLAWLATLSMLLTMTAACGQAGGSQDGADDNPPANAEENAPADDGGEDQGDDNADDQGDDNADGQGDDDSGAEDEADDN